MAETPVTPEALVAPKILLMGDYGHGKSSALRTLFDRDQKREVFVIQTEPNEILDDIPCSAGLHMARVYPAQISVQTIIENARRINTMSMKQLQEMVDPNKYKYDQFITFATLLEKFVCYRCKGEFGNHGSWPASRILAVDGMTGLSQMSLDLAVGSKPIKTQPEWGAAMDNLQRLIEYICYNTDCGFILIAHVERETDELSGGVKTMASTLGRKLAPKLPRPFSDVIMAKRTIGNNGQPKYYWDTIDSQSSVKTRNLPLSNDIRADFKQIFDTWEARVKKGAQPA